MEQTKYVCDICHNETRNGFIHMRDILVRQSNGNGNMMKRTIGYRELNKELNGKTVCSFPCFHQLLSNIGDPWERRQYFIPGEQVGNDSPQGPIGK
jgi:hypothetical protein